jgi:hypothetical protein
MKVRISQAGVFNPKGERIPVGAELSIKGDTLPTYLVGKCIELEGGKTAVTNPAPNPELDAAKARATELEIEFASNIGLAKLQERIAAKEAEIAAADASQSNEG